MSDSTTIGSSEVRDAFKRVARALKEQSDYLTDLDQAMGDGDLGITAKKASTTLEAYIPEISDEDLGKSIMTAGMKVNGAAPSTLGTLLATALMQAGKVARGQSQLDADTLVAMLQAADEGIQSRGKASPGDKTIVDALHPAAEAFREAIEQGESLAVAAGRMVEAAESGLESVTPLRSRVGRASWVGERTEGLVDPGCAAFVIIAKALAGRNN